MLKCFYRFFYVHFINNNCRNNFFKLIITINCWHSLEFHHLHALYDDLFFNAIQHERQTYTCQSVDKCQHWEPKTYTCTWAIDKVRLYWLPLRVCWTASHWEWLCELAIIFTKCAPLNMACQACAVAVHLLWTVSDGVLCIVAVIGRFVVCIATKNS